MTIFAILPPQPTPRLDANIGAAFPNDSLKVAPNQWLVSAAGTAMDIAKKVGVLDEDNPPEAMVLAMTSYHGRAPTPVWDWIKAKLEAKGGG